MPTSDRDALRLLRDVLADGGSVTLPELLDEFKDAVMAKIQRGDMEAAASFIEKFDARTKCFTPELRDKLRRGMFLLLK